MIELSDIFFFNGSVFYKVFFSLPHITKKNELCTFIQWFLTSAASLPAADQE